MSLKLIYISLDDIVTNMKKTKIKDESLNESESKENSITLLEDLEKIKKKYSKALDEKGFDISESENWKGYLNIQNNIKN